MKNGIEIVRGEAPLVLCLPHTGTQVLDNIGLINHEVAIRDTDWWVDQLYDFASDMGFSVIRTPWSRSVIDVNRDPEGMSLYPGQTTTALCPLETFEGEALYLPGHEPNEAEIKRRLDTYFWPYHQAIEAELKRLQTQYETVVLYDSHAIRSRLPRLFDGDLPHLNIGTHGGASCDPKLTQAVVQAVTGSDFSHVVNGRFKGGWTTRHYGQPHYGIHALQMEISFRAFVDEPLGSDPWPVPYVPGHAEPLQIVLKRVLNACLAFTSNTEISS